MHISYKDEDFKISSRNTSNNAKENIDESELKLSGPKLCGSTLSGPKLSGPIQSGNKLSRPKLSGPISSAAKLSGPIQLGPKLSGPKLSGPIRSGPTLSGPIQSGPKLSGPIQSGPKLSGPIQLGPKLSGPKLSGPIRAGPKLSDPIQLGPKLSGPKLSGPIRSGTKLSGPIQSGQKLPPSVQKLSSLIAPLRLESNSPVPVTTTSPGDLLLLISRGEQTPAVTSFNPQDLLNMLLKPTTPTTVPTDTPAAITTTPPSPGTEYVPLNIKSTRSSKPQLSDKFANLICRGTDQSVLGNALLNEPQCNHPPACKENAWVACPPDREDCAVKRFRFDCLSPCDIIKLIPKRTHYYKDSS